MTTRKKDAMERLRAQVTAATKQARENRLWAMEIPQLRQLAATHKLGTTLSGWVNPYPKSDPRSLYLEYQFPIHHDQARFKAVLASRQTGKDFTLEGEAVEDCYRTPSNKWMIAAPSERQSLTSLDQAKLWAEAYELYIEDFKIVREGGPETLLKSAEIL